MSIQQTSNDNTDDKFEILMNKINSLEKELLSERAKSKNFEEELNILKDYKLPSLYQKLDEKDNYIDSLLIQQIALQKEINYLKDNFSTENESDDNDIKKIKLSKYILPSFQDEKDKLIIYQTNKLDYLSNVYKKLKKDLKEKENEIEKLDSENKSEIKTRDDQINTLKELNTKNEEKILDLNEELTELTNINKNLVLEISTLNDIITDINSEKEKYLMQNDYNKKENNFIFENNLLTLNRIQKQDEDYKKMNDLLEEYKTKLSEVDTKTYIFKVTSIGKIVESSAEIVFYKEGKNNYVVNINYITSSYKYNILDIEDIAQFEGDETIFVIKYIKSKDREDEMFRTKEINKILKIYQDFKKKAMQHVDVLKNKKEEKKREKLMKKNVNDMFNIW